MSSEEDSSDPDDTVSSSPAGDRADEEPFWGNRVTQREASSASGSGRTSSDDSDGNGEITTTQSPSAGSPADAVGESEIQGQSQQIREYIQADEIEWRGGYVKLDDTFAKSYVIGEWPYQTRPHFMQSLWEHPSISYDLSMHFKNYDRTEAVRVLSSREDELQDKAEGEFAEYIPNTEAIAETLDIVRSMKRRIENENEPLVSTSIILTVYARSEEALERIDRDIREILEVEAGLSAINPSKIPERALVSSSPLGIDQVTPLREESGQPMLGTSASHTFPFINDTILEQGGVLMGTNVADNTPIILDIYNRNNGYNKLVIGNIGSGKSFSEGQYLIRHKMTNPDDNIIIIDPMGGFIGVTKAIGGERIVVNGNETINPLQLTKTPDHILERKGDQLNPYRMKLEDVRWFFNRFFEEHDTNIGSDQWAVLDRAIKKAYRSKGITPDPQTHDNPSPTIRDVMGILGTIAENPDEFAETSSSEEVEFWEKNASYLLMSLEPFREGNELDNLVGETDLEIDSSRPTYIDMQQMDGREDLGLMMKIVFSMIYEEIKSADCRTIVAIDEAHKIIGNEQAADHWQEIFRHSRHHDASIHLLSQEFEDFFGTEDATEDRANEAAKTMANQCTVHRIHRVNNVNRRLAKEALDLTDDHIDFIENAVAGEEGKGYTTALLNIDDIGSAGLRVEATEEEVAAIEYDPDEAAKGGQVNLDSVESKRIRRAIKMMEGLVDPLPDVSDDELLKDLLAEVNVTEMSPKATEMFTDQLINDPSTGFTEEDRAELLDKFLGDRDPGAVKNEQEELESQSQSESDSAPPWKQNEPPTFSHSAPSDSDPVASSNSSSKVNTSDPDQPNSEVVEGAVEQSDPPTSDEGPFDNPFESKGEDPFTSPEVQDGDPDNGEAMSFSDRVERHKEAVEKFPDALLRAIADESEALDCDSDDATTDDSFKQRIAEYHARAEIERSGHDVTPAPTDLPAEHEEIVKELHQRQEVADD